MIWWTQCFGRTDFYFSRVNRKKKRPGEVRRLWHFQRRTCSSDADSCFSKPYVPMYCLHWLSIVILLVLAYRFMPNVGQAYNHSTKTLTAPGDFAVHYLHRVDSFFINIFGTLTLLLSVLCFRIYNLFSIKHVVGSPWLDIYSPYVHLFKSLHFFLKISAARLKVLELVHSPKTSSCCCNGKH